MFQRILVATDFSDASRDAAKLVRHVAAAGAKVRLVHVLPTPLYVPLLGAAEQDMLTRAAAGNRAQAERRLKEFLQAAGLDGAEVGVRQGPIAREMADEAREWRADLLVIGGRPHGFVERFLLGTKAKSILRSAEVPVLVGRAAPGHAEPGVRRVAVLTDFYEPARSAGKRALQLAKATDANLYALHVVDPGIWGGMIGPVNDLGGPGGELPVDRAWLERTMRSMLHRFNKEVLDERADEVMRPGDPVDESLEFADEKKIDVLVVGTHGPGALERAVLGSVAEGIAERAPCSVLVVRPKRA